MKHNESGFVMLGLLLVMGSMLGILVELSTSFSTWGIPQQTWQAESRVQQLHQASQGAYLGGTGLPTNINQLGASLLADGRGDWAQDPFATGVTVLMQTTSIPGPDAIQPLPLSAGSGGATGQISNLSFISIGRDQLPNTVDDITVSGNEQIVGRISSRNRLRVLRAAFLRSSFMDAPTMTATDRSSLRIEMRRLVQAQRKLLTAGLADRAAILVDRDAAASNIHLIRANHPLLLAIPSSATGTGGLLQAMGLPDSKAMDGFQQDFQTALTGFKSIGADATGDTADDF